VVPIARGDEVFREAGVRVAAIAFLLLVAAVVVGWPTLIPVAVALAGGLYATQLAVDDAPLDAASPGIAVLLFLSAELAYWSLDERAPLRGDPGDDLRRIAVVAFLAIAAAVVAALLLALVDAVRAESLGVDLAGAVAAVAALAIVVAVSRTQQTERR
jgi:ABC-type transport system involved in cytochrome c biogenesis permease subunit